MQECGHDDKSKPDPILVYKTLYAILSEKYGVIITLKTVKKIDKDTNEEIIVYQASDNNKEQLRLDD